MTDSELLSLALQGNQEGWQELHQLCLNREIAEQVARALERSAHQGINGAAAWANLLEELHPGLKVILPPPSQV